MKENPAIQEDPVVYVDIVREGKKEKKPLGRWEDDPDNDMAYFRFNVPKLLEEAHVKAFEQTLAEKIRTCDAEVIALDLRRLRHFSSAALAGVDKAHDEAERQGRTLALCAIEPGVREVFELIGLDKKYHLFDTLSDVASAYATA